MKKLFFSVDDSSLLVGRRIYILLVPTIFGLHVDFVSPDIFKFTQYVYHTYGLVDLSFVDFRKHDDVYVIDNNRVRYV